MKGVVAHNDCVHIVYLVNYRLGEELKAAKERGEVAKRSDGALIRDSNHVSNRDKIPATHAEIGITRKQVRKFVRLHRPVGKVWGEDLFRAAGLGSARACLPFGVSRLA